MAPSFISMLMAHSSDKRGGANSTTAFPSLSSVSASTPSNGAEAAALPQIMGRSTQFGLPSTMGNFQRPPFGQTHTTTTSSGTAGGTANSNSWSDRQKVQDFFRHTALTPEDALDSDRKSAAQDDDKAIDVRDFVVRKAAVSSGRGSSATSSTSSEDNQQETVGRGRLQSALEDMLARQQNEDAQLDDEPVERAPPRRRPHFDSFDSMMDGLISDDDYDNQMDDSPYSTPARSRNNSEDFFGGPGLLEMLSQRHMPAGVEHHASLADMLAKRPLPRAMEDNDSMEWEESAQPRRSSETDDTELAIPEKPVEETGRSNMLAEMLAKRAAPSTSNDSAEQTSKQSAKPNPLEAMLAKRAAPSADSAPKKVNPLEAMLAKRAAPPQVVSAPEKAEEESSGAAHPLAAMLKQRQATQAPVPATEAPSSSPAAADSSSSEKDQTPLKDHPKYEKYFKMLKVGLPPPVVKHKMQSEDVDPAILDMDPNKPLPEMTQSASGLDAEAEAAYQAQLKEYEAKHGKYTQMVKVGLPPAVVEHKMRMDGVDPAWLNGPPKRPEPKTGEPTEEERAAHRKKYHKYFNMLRMGLPRGAVEHKMRMAGVDPKELDGPVSTATPVEQPKPKTLKRKDSIRKKLHWEGKKHGGRARRDSLWGASSFDEAKEQVSDESRAMLEKLFVKSLTDNKKRNSTAKSDGAAAQKKKKAMVQLIDMKKSQNIAITLARVKLSYPELKREILAMNPTVLSTSQVRSLMDMWPDRKEEEAIKAFKGDIATIGAAEKFLVEVSSVPRFREKLGCLVFKQEFPSRAQELRKSLSLVIRGVHQVCSSAELRQLFIYILQIGNLLNFGDADSGDHGVEAFSLGSLVKFSQTKAFVGGITFLQYVVQSIERDVPQLAHFYNGIDLISKCSKVAFNSLASEKNALEAGWQKLLREADVTMETPAASDAEDAVIMAYTSALNKFCKEAEKELSALQELLDDLNKAKEHFLEYFEEEDTEDELDVLLSYIANFTEEYRREHNKYQAKMKKEMMGLYSKFSPAKNPVKAAEPKQDPKTPDGKVHHNSRHPQEHRGRHGHGKTAPHPHRTALPPQIDHPQPLRQMHHARVLHLEIPQDDDMDDVSSTASMSPKTSAALSDTP
ncbi:hypothetical protein PHYBOEH_010225 [Phytophthora boehmeriae]|uniref:FH2 domain-containing protein n=1 Tax=Phytophthora boehmeriae TaxID=109152 RepID=A0A8T1VTL9_9STRA|nr:hypothetical protein PHYBOEH_010225 [Phytophthora boehmeriae]